MIISKTPFRISFFGGGTDYPAWYEENGGAVLAATIDKYCYITCRYLPPFFEHRYRILYSDIEMVKDVAQIRHPSVRGCLMHTKVDKGVEIHHDGDLPARTGLGSSSAFTVGMLKCLYALKGRMVSNWDLALEAMHVEQNVLRENVGCQDQVSTAIGGVNLIRFGPGRNNISFQPFIVPPPRLESLRERLLLFFTGVSRNASEIAAGLTRNLKKKERDLKEIGGMVDAATRILSDGHSIGDLGRLLDEGWRIKRSLSEGVTTPLVDALYDKALKAGARGGKLLGAGGGGFLLIFAEPDRHEAVIRALSPCLHVPFQFENLGCQIIYYKPDEYDD
jgi:D-glycero-alpha-D-manno-heptose-7-phosphate kinase